MVTIETLIKHFKKVECLIKIKDVLKTEIAVGNLFSIEI